MNPDGPWPAEGGSLRLRLPKLTQNSTSTNTQIYLLFEVLREISRTIAGQIVAAGTSWSKGMTATARRSKQAHLVLEVIAVLPVLYEGLHGVVGHFTNLPAYAAHIQHTTQREASCRGHGSTLPL